MKIENLGSNTEVNCWRDIKCHDPVEVEYCESFCHGKGCAHIKTCKFYKEAKNAQ